MGDVSPPIDRESLKSTGEDKNVSSSPSRIFHSVMFIEHEGQLWTTRLPFVTQPVDFLFSNLHHELWLLLLTCEKNTSRKSMFLLNRASEDHTTILLMKSSSSFNTSHSKQQSEASCQVSEQETRRAQHRVKKQRGENPCMPSSHRTIKMDAVSAVEVSDPSSEAVPACFFGLPGLPALMGSRWACLRWAGRTSGGLLHGQAGHVTFREIMETYFHRQFNCHPRAATQDTK